MKGLKVFVTIALVILAGSFLIIQVSGNYDPPDSGSGEHETTIMTECQYLNSIRANYTICCEYPTIVIWTWKYDNCQKACPIKLLGTGQIFMCCVQMCAYGSAELIDIIYDDAGNVSNINISPEGLHKGFMLSIGNDSRWDPVIRGSVERCYEQYIGVETGLYCKIPKSLFEIIDCTYIENFSKCPVWNPHSIQECQYAMEYVQKCYSLLNTGQYS